MSRQTGGLTAEDVCWIMGHRWERGHYSLWSAYCCLTCGAISDHAVKRGQRHYSCYDEAKWEPMGKGVHDE